MKKRSQKLLDLAAWALARPKPQTQIHKSLFASFSSEKEVLQPSFGFEMKRYTAALFHDEEGRADEQVIISLAGAVILFGLQVYVVVALHQAFNALDFGAGVGTLLGATSAGFGWRARWTPRAPTADTIQND